MGSGLSFLINYWYSTSTDEATPFAEFSEHWYFIKNENGNRVPVSSQRQKDLEESDKHPPILVGVELCPKIAYNDRIFIKHPWKNRKQ